MKYPCELVERSQVVPLADTRVRGGWVLAAAILGSSMAFIDGTVVNGAPSHAARAQRHCGGRAVDSGVLRALSCRVDLAGRHRRRFLWTAPDVRHLVYSFLLQLPRGAVLRQISATLLQHGLCRELVERCWFRGASPSSVRLFQSQNAAKRLDVVRIYWHHSGDRSGAGRMAGSASFLALGLLYQPAHCRGGDCDLIFVCPRESRRPAQSKLDITGAALITLDWALSCSA